MSSSVKRALVVGGTGGIGHAMATRIAADAPSSHVIVSGRNKPQTIPSTNIEFRPLDASSMRAIKRYTDEYKAAAGASDQKLDMLVLTQGILTMAGRTETPEGIDRKMALHYYGRQLLIRELLPVLKDDAKVVVVLDSNLGSPKKLYWDDLDLKKNFSLSSAAGHCTSMTDAMVQQFAAEQEGTANKRQFIHAYPGFVSTNIAGGLPWYVKGPLSVLSMAASVSPAQCAEALLGSTYKAFEAGRKTGTFWSSIDNKGNLTNAKKTIWTTEQRKKVAEHTWAIIDDALKVVD